MKFFYYYLAAISVFAVLLTVYDKRAARKGKWRISESALLCTAALGGSVAMFLTMLLIRHRNPAHYSFADRLCRLCGKRDFTSKKRLIFLLIFHKIQDLDLCSIIKK